MITDPMTCPACHQATLKTKVSVAMGLVVYWECPNCRRATNFLRDLHTYCGEDCPVKEEKKIIS